MVTKDRAQQQFVNRYRKLTESLTRAKEAHKRKPDSVSEKRIEDIEDKMDAAKADFFDTEGGLQKKLFRAMPKEMQFMVKAPIRLRGNPTRRKSGGKVARRGGGMVGRNKIIQGYKKGGQV